MHETWQPQVRADPRRHSGQLDLPFVLPQLHQCFHSFVFPCLPAEPVLASFSHMTVIMHSSLQRSLAFILANKLQSSTLLGTQLTRLFVEAYEDDPSLVEAAVADLQAVVERDPACDSFVQPLLFFKGFQAIQAHRVGHWMWQRGRKALAVALQSRMSEVFGVDIHPAAQLGWGVMMDHATGIVIGETAVVGDNVSMLHHVTLGGSGTGTGMRHPVISDNVLIGACSRILGNIRVGHSAQVAAGSLVLREVPPRTLVGGAPAIEIGRVIGATAGRVEAGVPFCFACVCISVHTACMLYACLLAAGPGGPGLMAAHGLHEVPPPGCKPAGTPALEMDHWAATTKLLLQSNLANDPFATSSSSYGRSRGSGSNAGASSGRASRQQRQEQQQEQQEEGDGRVS
ncbi:hypothetical protein CHLNCDRAFT_35524 [Chlorella variabilis]|uniref:serine O-acetyltransferase n=1 Tax=Chlorella variabilis TaxID=554065 RepID=E1ZFH6_CHLVA|nr:hypothetical protein CHLNCDRAFT_35524 [Chlorella variabilis]EFN55278.1 hypothetical protein CHLNCDRAFT_35524 [Chlorella variabilis]|eukprot:XP_005847380.1 hypothetical protein CHLNCDRAFT_35524 [Chlorella variabilis]